ncbi:MAG: methyltransferase, partial [Chitinophagaceae bacterium]|nr:methyltransferase [Chitinophagaceae bacterium]
MPQDVETYAVQHSSQLEPLLQEVLAYTEQHHPKAHMISGAVQGLLLQQLSQMLRPKRILEIGTFTGFSALCLAAGLATDGLLYTIEMRAEDAATAQTFFDRSVYKHQLHLLQGD